MKYTFHASGAIIEPYRKYLESKLLYPPLHYLFKGQIKKIQESNLKNDIAKKKTPIARGL